MNEARWQLTTCIMLICCLVANGNPPKLPLISERPAITVTEESTRRTLQQLPLHHIEGIWRFADTGAVIAICRKDLSSSPLRTMHQPSVYNLTVLFSPHRAIAPGTLAGYIVPTAKPDTYEARIYTQRIGTHLTHPRIFRLKLTGVDNSSIIFAPKRSKYSFNLWRFLPYMWRYSVHTNPEPEAVNGCHRIFPTPAVPLQPVYY